MLSVGAERRGAGLGPPDVEDGRAGFGGGRAGFGGGAAASGAAGLAWANAQLVLTSMLTDKWISHKKSFTIYRRVRRPVDGPP